MPAKTILWSLCGIVIISGIIYLAMKKPEQVEKTPAPVKAVETSQSVSQIQILATPVPTRDAPSDAIVDYLVDGLAHDDMVAAETSIDDTKPKSSDATTVNTNF